MINFSDKKFVPYLQISFEKNKLNYQKSFKVIAKMPPKKQDKAFDKLGKKMVADIKGFVGAVGF